MNKTPLLASLMLAFALAHAPLYASIDMPAGVAWKAAAQDADIDAAFAQAKAEKKPVLLYWGAKWCPPCNQLKATLFNRADFIQQSKALVAVNIDGDLPGAQKLGTRFSVRGYPTLILFNADGKELTRLPGEADAPRVIKLLQMGMAGGRPIQAVLADARAGKALKSAEWQLLGYYSWETDQDQLVKAAERGALLQKLSQAKGVPEDARVRLAFKALANLPSGASPAAGDAALLDKVLADDKLTRTHLDVLSNFADDLVKALHRQPSAERDALRARLDRVLAREQADTKLSRADRVQCLIARVNLARLDTPASEVNPKLDPALLTDVRGFTRNLDSEIKDGYERQAVIYSAGHLLGIAGLWADSDALLKANLSKSHSPYYFMSVLGGNARKTGRTAEALQWYERAFNESKGPATRLQWGSGYYENLVKLAPMETAKAEKVASQLIQEAAQDPGSFYERSARSMKKVSDLTLPWADAAQLARLQGQLAPVCAKLDAKSKPACDSLFKKG
ncbi:thioredoxin fold domain-containing protein [Inhella sp.]|uniref:thioredoxin fold domain-containing protein n=1 Tax=Inhella sp. TaxID=1921806 RepID=UPI0035ADC0EC